jgi:hypothetical protein
MRRKAFLGALLLPLPFAVLPVVAISFGGSTQPGHTLVVQSPASDSVTISSLFPGATTADPLAYGITEPKPGGCGGESATES